MRSFIFALGVIALAGTASAQMLNYTFDSDNQGWRQGDFNNSTIVLTDIGAATWNSGGYIDGGDFAGWAFHLSPVLTGSYLGATSIKFDHSTSGAGGPWPLLVLTNGTEAIFRQHNHTTLTNFVSYDYSLTDATGWLYGNGGPIQAATLTNINNVLAGLTRIGINADIASGADYTRVDNVQLVPEPATMTILALAGIAAARRKRRTA